MSHQDVVPAEGEWIHAPFPEISQKEKYGAEAHPIPKPL